MIDEIKKFQLALKHGDKQKIKDILSKNPSGYNASLLKETDALSTMCGKGDLEVVRLLIEYGAKVNRSENVEYGPFHMACSNGNIEIVKLLIDHGAHIDELDVDFFGCNNGGKTPLHYASNKECIQLLLNHGAKINAKDDEGKTPLHYAYDGDYMRLNEECIRLLIKHGANINSQDIYGKTPLHYFYSKPDFVMVLLELGANPTIKDKNGRTALDEASDALAYSRWDKNGNLFCVDLLHEYMQKNNSLIKDTHD